MNTEWNAADSNLLGAVEDRVLTITLNRPDSLNAITGDMLIALNQFVERAAEDDDIGAIVLTGAGRSFCAGGDLKNMSSGSEKAATMEARLDPLRRQMEVSRLLHDIPKPTIAMLRGPVAGAGMSLALACDMRMADPTVRIVTAFARVGLSGDFGGTWFLTQLVGPGKAKELYLSSPTVEADEAKALGIVNRLFAADVLAAETQAFAAKLANGPRIALAYIKRNLIAAETGTLAACLDLEAVHHARCGMTEDHVEAAKAFVEKRQPHFQGR
jgi:2-(1,2-epoxy-1,2-dihydrophenyl)acetyl-CoA isomerase